MTIDMSQFYQVFFEESEELLAEAEKLLLNLDIENPDSEDLNAIFRAAHSIKGGAATFSMTDMAEITHVLESLLDKIRKNEMALTLDHVDAFLAAKDVLTMQLDGHRSGSAVDLAAAEEVKAKLKLFAEQSDVVVSPMPVMNADAAPAPTVESKAATVAEQQTFRLELPELSDKDLENLKSELELLGTVTQSKAPNGRAVFVLGTDESQDNILAICSFVLDPDDLVITTGSAESEIAPTAAVGGKQSFLIELPEVSEKDLANLKSELELLGSVVQTKQASGRFAFTLSTEESKASILSICSFVLDPDDLVVTEGAAQKETALPAAEEGDGYGFFTPMDHQQGQQVQQEQHAQPVSAPSQPVIVETPQPAAAPAAPAVAAEKPQPAKREAEKQPASQETTSIRVGIEKVDQLINLIGEL
ncbi:MAG TPA: Hpt domain-containing protein, partial [Methylophilaceae bacterium]|nr:Hpt domain-containing protein [Methylophilaceae bacterium]